MKYRQLLRLTAFVGAFGVGVPGCFLFGSDENNEGRICASPVEAKTYCVSASSGPSAAWNTAAANGTEPIQMWAVWPKGVELTAMVASPNLLNVWLDDVQTVMDYLRSTQGNAESYHASLSGKLGENLRRASLVKNGIIHDKSVDPRGRVRQALFDKAINEADPLKAEIAADKQTMGDVQTIVDQAKLDAAPFASQYKALVDEFAAYRITEAAETAAYTKLSHLSSKVPGTFSWLAPFLGGAHGCSSKFLGHRQRCMLPSRQWRNS